MPVVIRGQRRAAPDEVTAFATASSGLDVPFVQVVLQRLLMEFHKGEYRPCIIDACSAADIALDAALTARLHARSAGRTDREPTAAELEYQPGILALP